MAHLIHLSIYLSISFAKIGLKCTDRPQMYGIGLKCTNRPQMYSYLSISFAKICTFEPDFSKTDR